MIKIFNDESAPSSRLLIGVMLTIHSLLVVDQAVCNAPVIDEPRHLVAGALHIEKGCFDIFHVNPPLTRMFAALAIEEFGPPVSWRNFSSTLGTLTESTIARNYVHDHGNGIRRVFVLARLHCLPFSIVGALSCYFWSNALFGKPAGVISIACWCFCPLIQGAASVILPDLSAASLSVSAAWRYWVWLRVPVRRNAGIAMVLLGGALLCKTTTMLLVPPFVAAFLIQRYGTRNLSTYAARRSGLFSIVAGAVFILNAGYLFEGTFKKVGDYKFLSSALSGVSKSSEFELANGWSGTWLAHIRVPFPQAYINGIDILCWEHETGHKSYLRRHWQDNGWWYFYLYAAFIKVPIPILVLAVMAVSLSLQKPYLMLDATAICLLIGFPILFGTALSLQFSFSHHLRYLLPAYPFIFVLIGGLSVLLRSESKTIRTWLLIMVFWLLCEGLSCHPHQQSYFNELVGGPRNGHLHLLESNTDWGQDLYGIDEWLAEYSGSDPVLVDYYGFATPREFGVCRQASAVIETPEGGHLRRFMKAGKFWLLISATLLHSEERYRSLRDREPSGRIGYSIFVYHIDPSSERGW